MQSGMPLELDVFVNRCIRALNYDGVNQHWESRYNNQKYWVVEYGAHDFFMELKVDIISMRCHIVVSENGRRVLNAEGNSFFGQAFNMTAVTRVRGDWEKKIW